jgi:hypothetical protein
MTNIIDLKVNIKNVYEEIYPLLEEKVFHYTSGSNIDKIMKDGLIHPNKLGIPKTSEHSHESMGKLLNAVCLFDLRNKPKDQIEKIRGWYNFLLPRFEENVLGYCVLSSQHYPDICTLEDLNEETKAKAMYLPHIESWHKNSISLNKLESIYRVTLI